LLLHILAHAPVEANATLVTIASFVVQYVLEGDFGGVAPLYLVAQFLHFILELTVLL
jgi:hypothetical protein